MIQVIDNFLPDSYASHIAMSCYSLNWEYQSATSTITEKNYTDFRLDQNTVDYGQLSYTFFSSVNDNQSENRQKFEFYLPVVYLAQEKFQNIKIKEILSYLTSSKKHN
jgi:hypothetical protein